MNAIEIREDRMGGAPTFKGRRLTIECLLYHLSCGKTVEDFCRDYEIDESLVLSALSDLANNINGSWFKGEAK